LYGQQKDEVFCENGITFYAIKNQKIKGISWFLTRKKIENVINAAHKSNKIDVIEVPDWEGISAFMNLKMPIVVRLNGSDSYFCHLEKRPVRRLNFFLEKMSVKNASAHISVSQFTADVTNKVFGMNVEYKIIPNSVNTDDFYPKNDFEIEISPPIILYIGGIIRKKGVLEMPFYFNKIVEKEPQAQLHIIGFDMFDIATKNPSTLSLMMNLFTDKAKKNVFFYGSIPHSKIQDYIQSATICIFPSFAEAFPLSWLEAMSMQKPVIASNIGWAKELINDTVDGFLENPKNHEAFAQKILDLLQDKHLQNSISKLFIIENSCLKR
jgi:glycosyltransferase involved in cell wall biosynthesis